MVEACCAIGASGVDLGMVYLSKFWKASGLRVLGRVGLRRIAAGCSKTTEVHGTLRQEVERGNLDESAGFGI